MPPAFDIKEIIDEAYTFLYPLVLMDMTRLQTCSVEAWNGKSSKAPTNTFGRFQAFPPLDFTEVVRPNFDTLYSITFLDLTSGPVVVHVPSSDGRYYLLPILDMWSNVIACPGWRTTGTDAADYAFVPPGWTGSLSAGLDKVECTTTYVWIIGRTKTDGPADYAAVNKFQAGMSITPLANWGDSTFKPPARKMPTVPSFVDLKAAPLEQIEKKMSGEQFFAYAAELMKVTPPLAFDFCQVARMKHVGIIPGATLEPEKLSQEIRAAMAEAPATGHKNMRMQYASMAKNKDKTNGWGMSNRPFVFGSYGVEYLQRAMIALVGLGCNLLEDAIYPQLTGDSDGKEFEGGSANKYTIHFAASELPPVKAFWSFTLYDKDGFAVPNKMNRATLSSWMPLVYNDDGSLDLYFQTDSPGESKENNWLPTPSDKPWNLTLRLYAPEPLALSGSWCPPPAKKCV